MSGERWTREAAWNGYDGFPPLFGFNYLPSTAVNSTEMWQAETYDPATIDRELGWASDIGYNAVRVFLQELVFGADADGFLRRLDQFLTLADRRGLWTLPILFDDCAFAGKEPYLGPQAEPVPGVHNSRWTPCPSPARTVDPAQWPALEKYAAAFVSHFADDRRILAWDIYNEPGNNAMGNKSLPLLRAAIGWVRAARPTQPLTVGVWDDNLTDLNAASLELSDVISFHRYGDAADLRRKITELQAEERPIFCTEWMARTLGSRFETHLPVFREERVAAFQWGLVAGLTQTHFPWGSSEGASEPPLWFHDLLRPDGTPYDPAEVAALRDMMAASAH